MEVFRKLWMLEAVFVVLAFIWINLTPMHRLFVHPLSDEPTLEGKAAGFIFMASLLLFAIFFMAWLLTSCS